MTKRETYEQKTEKLLRPILEELRFDLYDLEFVKEAGSFYLRIFLDKEGGINIDDCETVSRRMSDLLDETDFIAESYILEVSSPGLGRQLKKDRHFERSLGEEVEVKLYQAIQKQKEWNGILKRFDETTIVIETEDGTELALERSNLANVRLAVHF